MARRSTMDPYPPVDARTKARQIETRVAQQKGQDIFRTLFSLLLGLIVLGVIVLVVMTGLGAMIVNTGTTIDLPQWVEDPSVSLYHAFFH